MSYFPPIFSQPPTFQSSGDSLSLLLLVCLATINHLSSKQSSSLSLNQCLLLHLQYALRRNYTGLLSIALLVQLRLHLMSRSSWNKIYGKNFITMHHCITFMPLLILQICRFLLNLFVCLFLPASSLWFLCPSQFFVQVRIVPFLPQQFGFLLFFDEGLYQKPFGNTNRLYQLDLSLL